MQMIESILADAAMVAAIRRDIHMHPELGFEEHRTSNVVAKALTNWGIEIHRGLAKTGVVGIIKGKTDTAGRAVGIRADMDALPITEKNTFGHASQTPGKMHACGHDGHTAMLLGAAKHLAANRDFDGTVYVVFQPAEEGGGGARVMVEEGIFDLFPMEAIFGAHNWPGMKAGTFAVNDGPCFASTSDFQITVRGKGAHAAMPHNGVDPVAIAAQMVQGFQNIISRNKRPIDAGVISVTMIHGGEANNVIPDSCEMRGTVRTFTMPVLDLIESRMREVAEHLCAAFNAECEFIFNRNYPPTINHGFETAFARQQMIDMVGSENVAEFEPTMGGEDFSYFLQAKPGCYFVIGNGEGEHRDGGHGVGPCMLHNPSYDFNDDLIPLGASLWARMATAWLAAPKR
ncbi:MAG: amidohydrolase [Rhizobacter sp.]|nr:amidohydrolase [Rhizobacter sp.]